MLKLNQVTVERAGKTLIKDINLELSPGRLYPLIGDNGSGKTTLLKTLTGIWPATQGQIHWRGEALLNKSRKEISKFISFTPHNSSIPFDYTVEQFIHMGLYAQGLCHTAKGYELLHEALQTVDALPFRHFQVNELSQGERQRIFIARALVTQADVLAFDEPTANVDKKYQTLIWDLMHRLAQQNKIVVIATHDLKKIKRYSQDAIALNHGSLVTDHEKAEWFYCQ